MTRKPVWDGEPIALDCVGEDLSKLDVQEVSTVVFCLETLDPKVRGRGNITMLSTFYQGARLNKGMLTVSELVIACL